VKEIWVDMIVDSKDRNCIELAPHEREGYMDGWLRGVEGEYACVNAWKK
jgi:hypothetical protein